MANDFNSENPNEIQQRNQANKKIIYTIVSAIAVIAVGAFIFGGWVFLNMDDDTQNTAVDSSNNSNILSATSKVENGSTSLKYNLTEPPEELPNWQWHSEPKKLTKVPLSNKEGKTIEWDSFGDKFMLINFWATWCGPCRREMPDFEELSEKLDDKILVLPINVENNAQQRAETFYKEIGLEKLPLIFASRDAIGEYRLRGLPVTILVNKSGDEIARYTGPANWADESVEKFLLSILPN